MVERHLAKVDVASSSLVSRSIYIKTEFRRQNENNLTSNIMIFMRFSSGFYLLTPESFRRISLIIKDVIYIDVL